MARRRTSALERAIEQLSQQIDALVRAREALHQQRPPVPTPTKVKPTPRVRAVPVPPIEDAS